MNSPAPQASYLRKTMITSRFALTLVALAVCRLAAAQGEATLLPGSVLLSSPPLPVVDTTIPQAPAAARILRGTDRVIAAYTSPLDAADTAAPAHVNDAHAVRLHEIDIGLCGARAFLRGGMLDRCDRFFVLGKRSHRKRDGRCCAQQR